MRIHILALALMAGAAVPASAQNDRTERRIEQLEQQVRALQRRQPAGAATVQPEIGQPQAAAPTSGVPATSAIADLTSRLDALERQLAALTGQSEENSNRLRQMEERIAGLQSENEGRAAAAQPTAPAIEIATDASVQTAAETPAAAAPARAGGDAAEEAYNAGFRLWEQKRYAEAQQALEAMAARYPNSRWASWARNLAGRAYLDDGQPGTAAKILLNNYETDPKGERAADSLYFLGQALARLNKLPEACRAYDELQRTYGSNMRDYLKQRLPQARAAAKCR